MELKLETLETMLKRNSREKAVARVSSVEWEPAVGLGENFGSVMQRARLEVVLGSGQLATKTLIVKQAPKLETHLALLNESRFFQSEIEVYSNIIPKMEGLLSEHGSTSDRLWPDCLAYRHYDELILEDLKESGFRNADRTKRLDLKHSLLVVRALGRLHAMSAALLHNGKISKTSLGPCAMASNRPFLTSFMAKFMNQLVQVIRQNWGPEWTSVADELNSLAEDVGGKLHQLWSDTTNKLIVLNHGDCWINNIMFKYDYGTDTPISLRFVDFQESHFNSCAWDLTYLFSTSLPPKERDSKEDEILAAYLASLMSTFQALGFMPDDLPSLDDIKEDLRRLRLYGIVICTTFLSVIMASKEDAVEIENLFDDESEAGNEFKSKALSSKEFTEVIQYELKKWYKSH